jgi:hypothetical protein
LISVALSLISVVASLVSVVAVAAAVAVAVAVAIVVAVAVVVAVVVVGYLGLKVGDGCQERLHLFYHAFLLGCVCHFLLLELMLHVFGAQTFDDLVDDGGGIRLVVETDGICFMSRWASLKWDLSAGQVFSVSSLLCHFLMSLEKIADRVMMMRPMLMSWVGVSADSAASAMFAYSLMAVNTVVIGLVWLYVVASSAALVEVRV